MALKKTLLIIACFLTLLVVNAIPQPPPLPDLYSGSVKINNQNAPVGTQIEIRVGETLDKTYTMQTAGYYNTYVGSGSTGNTIYFKIGGTVAGQGIRQGGTTNTLDLSITTSTCNNGATQQCGTSNVGECKYGTQTCVNGQWNSCVGNIEPTTETCNNKDDNCDGIIDNDLIKQCGTSNTGACKYGTQICSVGQWGACSGSVEPTTEVCGNGIDEDCSGADLACVYGSVNSTTTLNLLIDNSANTNQAFTGVHSVSLLDSGETGVVFDFNFTNSVLNLSKITVKKQEGTAANGEMLVKGINLPSGATKTIYIDKLSNGSTICVKDAEITSLTEVSSGCNQADEKGIKCNNTQQNGYVCEDLGSKYKISGLTHSGIVEQCIESWTCTEWSSCANGQQTRTCTDSNSCGTSYNKPTTTQTCSSGGTTGSSGGGGGGGGGGGEGGGSNLPSETSVLAYIEPGESGIYNFKKFSEISINKIILTVKTRVSNARIEVKEAKLTSDTKTPPGVSHRYISILTKEIPEEAVAKVSIGFAVPKDWIEDKNINTETVAIQRFKDNSWNKLLTKMVNSDSSYYYYEAESPGFSIFAITGEKLEQITPTKEQKEAKSEQKANETAQTNKTGLAGVTGAIVGATSTKTTKLTAAAVLVIVLIILITNKRLRIKTKYFLLRLKE